MMLHIFLTRRTTRLHPFHIHPLPMKSLSLPLALLAFLFSLSTLQAGTTQPNVVIFLADDAGWGDYSF